jgi:hypothetical protein
VAGLLNMSTLFQSLKDGVWEVAEEIHTECVPQRGLLSEFRKLAENLHQPYFPIYERPGWLKQYVMGPHDATFVENVTNDIFSGISVALTLIPQVSFVFSFHTISFLLFT